MDVFGRDGSTGSQNSLDIYGDMEYFGCGCESLVDLRSGQTLIQVLCDRHRALPRRMVEQMR